MQSIAQRYEEGIEQFVRCVANNERKDIQNYSGVGGGVMLLRYMSEIADIFLAENPKIDMQTRSIYSKKVSPQAVKIAIKKYDGLKHIDIPKLTYDNSISIYAKILNIGDEYNTQDGQIRWLDDNNYEVNLGQFRTIIPEEIKSKMDKWAKMDIPLQLAKEIRHKLKSIGKDYNTEDGQIRWLDYNGYDLHLGQFGTIIPEDLKKKMSRWSEMNLPLQVAKKIRQELEYIKDEYNTEDGQIRWLDANGYDLHLGQFRTIIPEKLKKKMRSWSKMNLTLQVAKKIRQELEDIKDEYNTQDGQIRWLQDNNYAMHLGQFRSVLPKDTKKKMSKWTKMDIPFELAKQILILNNRLGVYHIEVTLASLKKK